MFGWLRKRAGSGPWRPIADVPSNTVVILARRAKSTFGGAGGPVHYAPAARIGWKDAGGVWTDFATGAPLDIEPDLFMELPAIDSALPPLIPTRRRRFSP